MHTIQCDQDGHRGEGRRHTCNEIMQLCITMFAHDNLTLLFQQVSIVIESHGLEWYLFINKEVVEIYCDNGLRDITKPCTLFMSYQAFVISSLSHYTYQLPGPCYFVPTTLYLPITRPLLFRPYHTMLTSYQAFVISSLSHYTYQLPGLCYFVPTTLYLPLCGHWNLYITERTMWNIIEYVK